MFFFCLVFHIEYIHSIFEEVIKHSQAVLDLLIGNIQVPCFPHACDICLPTSFRVEVNEIYRDAIQSQSHIFKNTRTAHCTTMCACLCASGCNSLFNALTLRTENMIEI